MFMFIGLMLSDYAFATDKWYWQVLVYILSIIICVIDALITMIVPSFCINVVEGEEEQAGFLKKTQTFKRFLLWTVIFANVAFSVYALQFVIRYTIEFQKIRDIALLFIGGISILGMSIEKFIDD
jgi:hypothetical protein